MLGPLNEFRGPPIQDQGNDWKVPYNEFRFWGPKKIGRILNNPFKSLHRDLRTVGAQGGRTEDP